MLKIMMRQVNHILKNIGHDAQAGKSTDRELVRWAHKAANRHNKAKILLPKVAAKPAEIEWMNA